MCTIPNTMIYYPLFGVLYIFAAKFVNGTVDRAFIRPTTESHRLMPLPKPTDAIIAFLLWMRDKEVFCACLLDFHVRLCV